MPRIAFMGAGSTIFAKSVLGDCILTPEIRDLEISLHDIDPVRLEDSRRMLENIAANVGRKVKIEAHLNRLDALRGAKYVVNAIQVGGYDPCTITDFEIPKKYGLRQTIADTLGIGGIFRALRTIPVLEDFAEDMLKVCPDALFINYSNPMAMLTGYLQEYTGINSVGLCHSVQVCIPQLFEALGMKELVPETKWDIAGINHQAWLLEVRDGKGNDLYPEIKRRAKAFLDGESDIGSKEDKVRYELMLRFGYYITESSEHNAEYTPWFIKSKYPELIDRYNIPLDEYPRRCIKQIDDWAKMREEVVNNEKITHEKSREFASFIVNAMENDVPYRVHGNVRNNGLITNLPYNATVEVPCLVDRAGIHPCYVGDLPEQCAAINRTNINVQRMTIQAARSRKKEDLYMAAMLDPHTAAELSMDEIKSMCDEMLEAHRDWMPEYH
ncbi:MAG TPA: alpha-glucosidase/alpha-galactosidase [Candidatus Mediterraneibacter merdipullorum]|nr:alpha-glucosidase/alpha-galactosidase [Candidatus Mediterraneibacter merdipullorum]